MAPESEYEMSRPVRGQVLNSYISRRTGANREIMC